MRYSAEELARRSLPLTPEQLEAMEEERQGKLRIALANLVSERAAAMVSDFVLQQLDIHMDPHPWISECGARRASKTTYNSMDALVQGEERPGHFTIIGGPTKEWLEKNYWGEAESGIPKLAKRYRLEVKTTENALTWKHANGSWGVLMGLKERKHIEAMMGMEANRYVLDEMHRQPVELYRYAVNKIISPQAISRKAKVIVAGNPGDVCAGEFWKATDPGPEAKKAGGTCVPWREVAGLPPEEREAAWSFHHMTTQGNTAVPWQWEQALVQKRRNKWADDDPNWVQQYLGLWVYNPDALRFQYDPEAGAKPPGREPLYSLGVWLGDEGAYLSLVAYDMETGQMALAWEGTCRPTPPEVVKKVRALPAATAPSWMALGSENPMSDVMFNWFLQSGLSFERYRKSESASYLALVNGALGDGKLSVAKETETALQLQEAPKGSAQGFEYTQALLVAVGQLPAPPLKVEDSAPPDPRTTGVSFGPWGRPTRLPVPSTPEKAPPLNWIARLRGQV